MHHQYFHITHNQFTLSYQKFGSGPELLFCFHGFERSSDDFAVFEQHLGEHYTLFAFDFFYHGSLKENLEDQIPPFHPADLVQILEKIMWDNVKVKCSLMGYSLGGKLALGLIHRLPHRIAEVFLIAPDGLTFNPAFRFIARTMVGRKLGNYYVDHPRPVLSLINLIGKYGFISKKLQQFLQESIQHRDQRLRILRTWITLKNYIPHPKFYFHYLQSRKIRIELFYGKYDRIIPLSQGEKFVRHLKTKNNLHVLDAGHALLLKSDEISAIILKKENNKAK